MTIVDMKFERPAGDERRVLGIDPGAAATGWATDIGVDGILRWGTEDFSLRRVDTEGLRWLRFENWLCGIVADVDPGDLIVAYELQTNYGRRHPAAGEIGRILQAFLLKFCEARGIAAEAVSPQTLKSCAIPTPPRRKKGDPPRPPLDRGKEAIIAAAKAKLVKDHRGFVKSVGDGFTEPVRAFYAGKPISEHEADALWLYWYGKAKW